MSYGSSCSDATWHRYSVASARTFLFVLPAMCTVLLHFCSAIMAARATPPVPRTSVFFDPCSNSVSAVTSVFDASICLGSIAIVFVAPVEAHSGVHYVASLIISSLWGIVMLAPEKCKGS